MRDIFTFFGSMFLITIIAVLSVPLATISFFIAIQRNAWRFGKDAFKRFIAPKEFP